MNHEASYPYASGDLLEERNTYFYSAYQGTAFLEAWRQQRADALREMSGNPSTATPAEAASAPLVRATDILLECIHQQLMAGEGTFARIPALDRLVQRFEVSKRLHGEYDEKWRPVDSADYRLMERYVRFAEILERAHRFSGELPYLNALLKIVDTLTALRATLSTEQTERLRQIIAHERVHVEQLARRVTGRTHAA